MAERTFCQERVGWSRSRTANLHHGSGGRSRRAQRRRLFADYCFERFGNRVLWGNSFGRSDYGTVFWAANRERLRRSGGACSLLSADVGCDLSARTSVNWREFSRPCLEHSSTKPPLSSHR